LQKSAAGAQKPKVFSTQDFLAGSVHSASVVQAVEHEQF
jgi:hypothetical protein